MRKFKVTVCLGTTCYVMGSSELINLLEQLPAELKARVELKGSNCLNLCQQGAYGRAPFVMIDDEVVAEATPETVIARLRSLAGLA